VLVGICLRRRPGAKSSSSDAPRTFVAHRAWYVFTALGGLFLVGIFAYAALTDDDARIVMTIASAVAALLFAALAVGLARSFVVVDGTRLVYRSFLTTREVDLALADSVTVEGFVVAVRFRPSPPGARPAKPLLMAAVFGDLSDLIDLIARRAEANRVAG
jgi:hypothetical protein